jgi:hypothetical protein
MDPMNETNEMKIWVFIDSTTTKIDETIQSIKNNTYQPQRIITNVDKELMPASNNTYVLIVCGPIPIHLIAVYAEIISVRHDNNIYGLAGFIMNDDQNLSPEFKALTEGCNYDRDIKCKIAVTRAHMCRVHWVERYGTMLIPLSLIDLIGMGDIELCNYAAGRGHICIQICSLDLNIMMMYRQGYVETVLGSIDPHEKELVANDIIAKCRKSKFYLWEKQVPEHMR